LDVRYSGSGVQFQTVEGTLTENNDQDMDWVEIDHMGHPLINQVRLIYENSFEESERREFHAFVSRYSERTVQHAGYLYALVHEEQVVGITAFTVFARTAMIHLSIIATHRERRGQGFGASLLALTMNVGQQWLAERGHPCAGMVWEVERIAAASTETERAIRQKRVAFYEKAGGQIIGDFILPPLRPGQPALDLTVMYRPVFTHAPVPITEIVETVCREAYTLPDDHPGYHTIRATWEQRKS
jgi:GNAT superfamily N-acetyltransferase